MIIVGNAVVLAKDNFWNSLLTHFKNNECLFEGSTLKKLIPCQLQLQKPEIFYGERTRFIQDINESLSNLNSAQILPLNSYENKDLPSYFGKKFRKSEMGFDMLPEQKCKGRLTTGVLESKRNDGEFEMKGLYFDGENILEGLSVDVDELVMQNSQNDYPSLDDITHYDTPYNIMKDLELDLDALG
jgi:hypothetical protein